MDRIIHIHWEGPIPIENIGQLNDPNFDRGIYQIYACHPIYGQTLVYIGMTGTRPFAQRVPEEGWDSGTDNDPKNVEVYVGRLKGIDGYSNEEWSNQIACAEKLLIHAHAPAYNSTYLKTPPNEHECGNVIILNWGAVRLLQREVTGHMWSSRGMQYRNLNTFRAQEVIGPPVSRS